MEDYKEKYETLLRDIDIAIAGQKEGEVKTVLQNLKERHTESEDDRMRKMAIKAVNSPEAQSCIKSWGVEPKDVIAWLEKQGKKVDVIENFNTEFERQISHLIASTINKEHEYNEGFVKWAANALLNYAKHELEKQGEQKPTDKVESKFKIGDWIYHEISGNTCHINKIENGLYVSDEGATISLGRQNDWRLWTIQDAKDGDVLVDGDLPFIFKNIDANKHSYAYCGISLDYGFRVESEGEFGEWTWAQDITPSTKEQCDLLFQKMKEAGYEWDAEKKELKRIEQKPAWSEEDEKMLNHLIDVLYGTPSARFIPIKREIMIPWLKSLKERYSWKPSDEQIKLLREVQQALLGKDCHNRFVNFMYELKRLREE